MTRSEMLHRELDAAILDYQEADETLRALTATPYVYEIDLGRLAEATERALLALGRVKGFATLADRERRGAAA